MQVDAFSIVVVIIAFALFLIPIVLDKRKNKQPKDEQQDLH